jgi:hypothetical protein
VLYRPFRAGYFFVGYLGLRPPDGGLYPRLSYFAPLAQRAEVGNFGTWRVRPIIAGAEGAGFFAGVKGAGFFAGVKGASFFAGEAGVAYFRR